jgi:hypothetical protein
LPDIKSKLVLGNFATTKINNEKVADTNQSTARNLLSVGRRNPTKISATIKNSPKLNITAATNESSNKNDPAASN